MRSKASSGSCVCDRAVSLGQFVRTGFDLFDRELVDDRRLGGADGRLRGGELVGFRERILPAEMAHHGVDEDAAAPPLEGAGAAVFADVRVEGDESVVQQILGSGPVADVTADNAVHGAGIAHVQFASGFGVAFPAAGYDLLLCQGRFVINDAVATGFVASAKQF